MDSIVRASVVALSALILGAGVEALDAQEEAEVSGQIVSAATDQPIEGAQVSAEGTGVGQLAGPDGRYRLEGLPPGEIRVAVQHIGFAAQTRTVTLEAGESRTLDFRLQREALRLSELVATVGVTEARREEVGVDIARIDAEEEMETAAVANLSDLLSGRTAGLDVQQGTGPVGTASRIRARGAASIIRASNPLVIIDGIRASNETAEGPSSVDWPDGSTTSRLDDLDPLDIASIQTLRGPTAAALYGSEAAAGVIIIETKKGQSGEQRLRVSTEHGFSRDPGDWWDTYFNMTSLLGVTDPESSVAQQWNAETHPVTGDVWGYHNSMENPLTSPLETGYYTSTTASLSGGESEVTYYVSGRFEDRAGVVPNNALDRYSLRANVDIRPLENLDVAVNTSYLDSDVRLPESARSFRGFGAQAGANFPLFSFGVMPDGSRGDCLATLVRGDPESVCEEIQGNMQVTFDDLFTIDRQQSVNRFTGSVSGQWEPSDWLTNELTLGLDFIQSEDTNLFPLDPERPFGSMSEGFIRDQRHTDTFRTLEYSGSITSQLSENVSSVTTLGAQYFSSRDEMVGCIGEGFASATANACDASFEERGFSNEAEKTEVGAYLQQRFGLNEYLFVTAGLRVDDNSAFGANQGRIWSPSANASWAVSDMGFWDVDLVDRLRVRFAWGKAAQAPPLYAAVERWTPVGLDDQGGREIGISPAFPGNPDLTAERKEEIELGVDMQALDSRLGVALTYYSQETTDALVERFLAPSAGFRGVQFANIGALENEGFEVNVDAQVIAKESVAWNVGFQLSTQDPIVTSLGGQAPILNGSQGMFREGYPPGAYYGPIISEAERDEEGNIVPGSVVVKPGDIGDPNAPQDSYLGQPFPGNQQSLSTNLSLWNGRLQFSTLFERSGDVEKSNLTLGTRVPWSFDQGTDRLWAFRQVELSPEEQAAVERSLEPGQGSFSRMVTIEDGSFIKWREFSLTYRLPDSLLPSVLTNGMTVTVGGRNLLTWTDYRGMDPEALDLGGREVVSNHDFFSMPQPRSFFARVRFGL